MEDLSLFRSSPTAGLPVSRRQIGTEERRWPPVGGQGEPTAQQSRNSAWAATQVNSEVHTASASLTPASVKHRYEHLNTASGSDLTKMPSELVSRALRLKQFKQQRQSRSIHPTLNEELKKLMATKKLPDV